MFKNVKKKVMLAALVVLALGNTLSVVAATESVENALYAGYVAKFDSYHTTRWLYKTTNDVATNDVGYMSNKRSLCSWINNYKDKRVTEKKGFSSAGTYYMDYETEMDLNKPEENLSTTMTISTQLFEFGSADISGSWSPDKVFD